MSDNPNELSFEEKIKQLEGIVKDLEGDVELQKALDAYEKGIHLIKTCRTELNMADEKIKKLEEVLISEDGELTTKALEANDPSN